MKKPIRVLQMIGSLNVGGSQSMIINIYKNIDRKKIQFDFIVDHQNSLFYKEELEKLGAKIYVFPSFYGLNIFQVKTVWRTFFKEHPEYKIIHSHVRSYASIYLKIAKKYGLVTIAHSHSTSNGFGLKAFYKKILQKSIPKYSDYLFACSKESAVWLYGKKLANSKRCIIINNAIDSKKYRYDENIRNIVRKKFQLDNKIVIGQVGRLIDVKNHLFTIEIMKRLVEVDNNYYLLIVGSGPMRESIINKINNYALEKNVMLLENRNDVNELLQAMDIYIMPSLWEGLPLAFVEAQAASLPCIISNNVTDGILINELVSKVELNNIDNWIKAILTYTSKRLKRKDESLIIENHGFDINSNVKKLTDFYLKKNI